ncbi:MAG: hypothetical protein KGI52_14815 [Burkholderiales bacterium]|nr:hypothetical protein [Burkholderiales bacterium]
MTVFNESYGRDIRMDINLPNGVVLTLPEIIDIDWKPTNHTDTFTLITGRQKHNVIPQGGKGTLTVKRGTSVLEDFQAQFEANYYAGAPAPKGLITMTISNPDGTTTRVQLLGVSLIVDDMGTWKGDTAVMQKVSFLYERQA